MKVVILAGGLGTRLSEETSVKPKPMVEIGGKPILWHVMKLYSHYGLRDFIICCGYKGYYIKEYFSNYFLHNSDVTFDMKSNTMTVHNQKAEDWSVTLVDTGESSQTGGRLLRVRSFIEEEECFCMTYGDGLSDVNIANLIKTHKASNKLATVTSVSPMGRFGRLVLDGDDVIDFTEKPSGEMGSINGGFFVLSPQCLSFIRGDSEIWEDHPMHELVAIGEMGVFRHSGFWQPMDTLRDKHRLETLWLSNSAPWKLWEQ